MGSKPRDRYYSNPGSRIAELHAIRIDDLGHKTLVKTGEITDIYVKIQSHVDDVDITALWQRAQMEGYQVLDRREVTQGDLTIVPNSLMEAAQILQDQENKFNQLPIDIRREFNFDFNQYIAESGRNIESWSKKMGLFKEPETTKTPEPQPQTKEGGEQ